MTEDLRKRVVEIVDKLDKAYPEAHLELDFSTPFELLVATILAAQCTDAKVNQVTRNLFTKYPTPKSYLKANDDDLRQDLQGITFSRNKAKYIKNCCQALVEKFGGQVPTAVEDLTTLSGVGRKTANIVRANAMGIPAIGVDTHTIRVPNRLGWVKTKTPEKIEETLCELLPEEKWHRGNIVIQWHGRYTCKARKPKCNECVIFHQCDWAEKEVSA
ncbi:MAG: endonuclease III [bacterium]